MHNTVEKILAKIKTDKNLDFTEYRESTITRRINRRVLFSSVHTIPEYFKLIKKDAKELDTLAKDLTIHVTESFRDPETWEIFKKTIKEETQIRPNKKWKIWSAGCSTGEEVYSLASMYDDLNLKTTITGTDIDQACLEKAVSQPQYNAKQKNIHFCHHDLVQDEPLGKFDLIDCRNVLIYFSEILQGKVLHKFYRSLKPKGILWLGNSETLRGESATWFETIDSKARIYRKKRI